MATRYSNRISTRPSKIYFRLPMLCGSLSLVTLSIKINSLYSPSFARKLKERSKFLARHLPASSACTSFSWSAKITSSLATPSPTNLKCIALHTFTALWW